MQWALRFKLPQSVVSFLTKLPKERERAEREHHLNNMQLQTVLDISDQDVNKIPGGNDVYRLKQDRPPGEASVFAVNPADKLENMPGFQDQVFAKRRLLEEIHRIRKLTEESVLMPSDNFQKLDKALESEVEIPFLKEKIGAAFAYWLLSSANIAVLGYLLGLTDALLIYSADKKPEKPLDWILLYPGELAMSIGFLWLMSPSIVAWIATFSASWVFDDDPGGTIPIAALILIANLVVGGAIIWRALRIRKRLDLFTQGWIY